MDLRGYGNSDRPEQHYDMDLWADDLKAILDDAGIKKTHVHGTSMGGMVAQRFTLAHPDRVASLVLMDTASAPLGKRMPHSPRSHVRSNPRSASLRPISTARFECGRFHCLAKSAPATNPRRLCCVALMIRPNRLYSQPLQQAVIGLTV